MINLLLKASKEREDFYNLIGTNVTFASDIISHSGSFMHKAGEKAFISDVEYSPGYWSNLCPDIYIKPKISTFKINGIKAVSWRPTTFQEYRDFKD